MDLNFEFLYTYRQNCDQKQMKCLLYRIISHANIYKLVKQCMTNYIHNDAFYRTNVLNQNTKYIQILNTP